MPARFFSPWPRAAILAVVLTLASSLTFLPRAGAEIPPSRFDPSNRQTPPPAPGIRGGSPADFPTGDRAWEPADFRLRDWAAAIDSTWGPSLMTQGEMLAIFDAFWNETDARHACFQDIEVDWAGLRNHYRPQISEGMSRGRFVAIMNHLSLALVESHTAAYDSQVNQSTPLLPGVPLLVAGAYGENGHFGAGLTPLPDSTLLVYAAVSPHPLGLAPGDLVLGYDGVPWKDIYPQLLAAELPITYGRTGSSPSSIRHCWMMSAGMNWHLFGTIDVVKYGTGDTLNLPLDPLVGQTMRIFCSEQLDIPGVPKPDLGADDTVSWGIIEGTDIGYIYLYKLRFDFEQQFYNAVDSLMTHHQTSGLIMDFRLNYGGTLDFYMPAFELLFNETVYTIAMGQRCSPYDHVPICPASAFGPDRLRIDGDPATFYDKPIALLTGPGAVSAGDIGPYMLTYHPRVRVFGRPSSAAFNNPRSVEPAPPNPWTLRYARYESYRVEDISHHLTHDEFPIDEEVWLRREDVVNGVDTVVEAAIAWIYATSSAPGAGPIALLDMEPNQPNPFHRETTLRYLLPAPGPVRLTIFSATGRAVRVLEAADRPAGVHVIRWDGRDGRGMPVASGVYLSRLDAGGEVRSGRVMVIR